MRRNFFLGIALATVVTLLPARAPAVLRPLVREMLEFLAATNSIGAAAAVNDFATVKKAALDLQDRAGRLAEMPVEKLGFDGARKPEFDAYLAGLRKAAGGVAAAAQSKDSKQVIRALQELSGNTCLACHESFRKKKHALRSSVLFMTGFLNAWRRINQGLMVKDYDQIARSARQLAATARVLTWDQVLRSVFNLDDPAKRKDFRKRLLYVTAQASRIEQAALEERPHEVLAATGDLWGKSCIPCHARYR